MEVISNSQLVASAYSLFFGLLLSAVYQVHSFLGEVLRVKKEIHKEKERFPIFILQRMKLFLWDFMYFVLISPICLIVAFAINNGIIRWYLLVSAIVGFWIYQRTIGKFIHWALQWFKQKLKEIRRKTVRKLIGNMKTE